MTITRIFGTEQRDISLTTDELFEAHREFVSKWMRKTALCLLDDESVSPTEEELDIVCDNAWALFCDEYGTEYECVECAVELFIDERGYEI